VLIEDYPGLAKTVIARSFAKVLGLGFGRIQFTPDLMPADVTGSSIFDQLSGTFDFRPGPVFTNLLLADEINRTPPKTQAALLEAMQERQVTTDGVTRPLERPFLVVGHPEPDRVRGHLSAARGPAGPLPAPRQDRLPGPRRRMRILAHRMERASDEVTLQPILDPVGVLELQAALEQVHVAEAVGYYIVDLVAATRDDPKLQVGASPRGALAVLKLARAKAVLSGRDFVTPDDVKAVAVPALAHRLTLRPELWVRRVDPDQVVAELLGRVPTPAAADARP
jgi:MoxR-like ATPase